MGRPLIVWKLKDVRDAPVVYTMNDWSLRIDKPEYRVWLSNDQTTIRVEEKQPDGPWKVVETYPAR